MKILISRRVLQTPFVAACSLFFLCGSIALVSRSRMSTSINAIFKSGIGAEYQSWFEHFLSGFASPSLGFMVAIPFGAMLLQRFRDGNSKNKIVLRAHAWIVAKSERDLLVLLLGFCALLYVAVSADWEFSQSVKRGTVQYGQLASDAVAAIIWFLLLRRL